MDDQSLDITAEKIAQLRAIFPEVFSEAKIDFARLKDILADNVVFPNEHYELSWAGKAEARKEIQKQTTATLIPDKENSVNFDTAGNIFIEGENLEVLRVLQKSYFGQVKMIYIDPPYNTGNDSFVYPDDYAERQTDYNKRTGITNGEGYLNKQDLWRKNTRENGQFHSVWLSMMYTRLYLARNLLREDGVIFVSIDDNEAADLKLLMDEVFGEENFVRQVVWQHSIQAKGYIGKVSLHHNLILIYQKSPKFNLGVLERTEEHNKNYANPDNDSHGKWRVGDIRNALYRPNLIYDLISPSGKVITPPQNGWRFSKTTMYKKIESGQVVFNENESRAILKIYLKDVEGRVPESIWFGKEVGTTREANSELKEIFGDNPPFDTPKPTALIKKCMQISTTDNEEDIVLDFFAGSGTTAQAVLELNGEDGGNRQFICVQIPEMLEEDSIAYKAGYRTIADICKARIQKVIAKLQAARAAELELNGNQQPLGFQTFCLAPSNFKQWRGDVEGEEAILQQLEGFRQSEKENSEGGKMLYELLLKAGYPLTATVDSVEIEGQTVYTVEDGKMLIFFDEDTPAINAYVH
ncbi:MAG: site-specific DNA-methyltransferase, partial [Deltaproteobacteria bacterium]